MPGQRDNPGVLLKERFGQFVEILESIEPEQLAIEDIDRLIHLISRIEEKFRQLKEKN